LVSAHWKVAVRGNKRRLAGSLRNKRIATKKAKKKDLFFRLLLLCRRKGRGKPEHTETEISFHPCDLLKSQVKVIAN